MDEKVRVFAGRLQQEIPMSGRRRGRRGCVLHAKHTLPTDAPQRLQGECFPGRIAPGLHARFAQALNQTDQHIIDPPLGTVITLAAPLEGAPLATLTDEVRDVPGIGKAGLGALDAAPVPLPDLDSDAVEDLAEDSAFMARLDAAQLPDSVQLATIGSLWDYVVPADRATGAGAPAIARASGNFLKSAGVTMLTR